MKISIIFYFCVLLIGKTNSQDFSAEDLLNLLSLKPADLERQLSKKRFQPSEQTMAGDTVIKTYQYRPNLKNVRKDPAGIVTRNLIRSALKESSILDYQTSSRAEYIQIINSLKANGFYCEYEKDSSIQSQSYLYQHEDYTAETSVKEIDETASYSIIFHKKLLPVDKEIHFAEDLLAFSSHEYLVYYFGANNVKKDVYYFSGNDVVKCSVLMINSNRQVIFIWKDGLNRRKIDNLLFGGTHKLESQQNSDSIVVENSWRLKTGLHAGMALTDLRILNEKDILFTGGNAANPGLVIPESSARVDFKNADVILGCTNCNDDNFQQAKIISADKAMLDGRVLFVLTIVLYPFASGTFD